MIQKNDYSLLYDRATQLRIDSIRATTAAGSGHPTSCMSAAELMAVIFFKILKYDYTDPRYIGNDRFILSKGHAVPILYAAFKQLGIISDQELLTLRSINSSLEGHPTPRFIFNEAATGSLGQGLSVGVGMALASRQRKIKNKTIVLLGDGEIAEGSVWEAAALASHYQLDSLIGIVDANRLAQSGQSICGHAVETYATRFKAFGWETVVINGHSIEEIILAFDRAGATNNKPFMIIAKTQKGYGLDATANHEGYHGKPFKKDADAACASLAQQFHSGYAPDTLSFEHADYRSSFMPTSDARFDSTITPDHKQFFIPGKQCSTRKAFGYGLAALGRQSDSILALDADVKNSTFTEIFEQEHPERFIQCFIAEQNMAGVATGLQARGFIPFAATFGAFFARAYDQIRMAAIGQNALRLAGSHCGVSIGEDGPSQMALEDIALMAAVPNSIILYPSDAVAAYKLVSTIADYHEGISYMRTTRADTPILYREDEQFVIGGCKVIRQYENATACIVAAGITLHEALNAHDALQQEGIAVNIIDLYSIKPLDAATLKTVAALSNNRLITVEDHYLQGGIGQLVAYALKDTDIKITVLAVHEISRSGTPEALMQQAGIDAQAIIRAVKSN